MESNYFPHIETRKVIAFPIFDAGSKPEFTNNSLKSPKIGKLNIENHATVPLNLREKKYTIIQQNKTKVYQFSFNKVCDFPSKMVNMSILSESVLKAFCLDARKWCKYKNSVFHRFSKLMRRYSS